MSLPWVSRALYESMCSERDVWRTTAQNARHASAVASINSARAEGEADGLRTQVAEYAVRYETLLKQFTALTMAGAVTPVAPKAVVVDVVTQAMIAKAGGNPILRRHYAQHIASERANGVDEGTIAAGILEGETDMEGVPG